MHTRVGLCTPDLARGTTHKQLGPLVFPQCYSANGLTAENLIMEIDLTFNYNRLWLEQIFMKKLFFARHLNPITFCSYGWKCNSWKVIQVCQNVKTSFTLSRQAPIQRSEGFTLWVQIEQQQLCIKVALPNLKTFIHNTVCLYIFIFSPKMAMGIKASAYG